MVPSEPLRQYRNRRFPPELLKMKIRHDEFLKGAHKYGTDKFEVEVWTPVTMGKLSVRDDLIQASNRYKEEA